jgi:hypothetical protein
MNIPHIKIVHGVCVFVGIPYPYFTPVRFEQAITAKHWRRIQDSLLNKQATCPFCGDYKQREVFISNPVWSSHPKGYASVWVCCHCHKGIVRVRPQSRHIPTLYFMSKVSTR